MAASLQELVTAISDIKEEKAQKVAAKLLAAGTSPLEVLEHCREAMAIVGERFDKSEYFLPELMMAGEILTNISEELKPYLEEETEAVAEEERETVVLGTVEGDIHDIGKNIVEFMLDINGFEVVDLGTSVRPEEFVEAVQAHDARVVGLSCLLTLAYDPMKQTVEAFREAGLRDRVKIMIGGAATNDEIRDYTGADAWGKDAVAAVTLARNWIGGDHGVD